MNFLRFSPTNWKIHAGGLASIAGLTMAAYLFQIQPLLRNRMTHAILTSDLSAKQLKITELKETLKSIDGRRAAAQRLLNETNLPLEPASQLNQRILKLTNLATENGLIIDVIEPGKSLSGTRYETIPIHLSGRGDYRSCTRFLKSIHASLHDSGLTRVELSASPSVNNHAPVGFSFDLVWYTSPSPRVADTK